MSSLNDYLKKFILIEFLGQKKYIKNLLLVNRPFLNPF
jgi:hypothetical protein